MPPIEFGGYLIEIFYDVGPVLSNGFGPVPISEVELAAWQFNRGQKLTAWECETIRNLSKEYVSMMHKSENPNMPAPYTAETYVTDERRKAVALGFKALAQKQNTIKGK